MEKICENVVQTVTAAIVCEVCGKPATCIGAYEGPDAGEQAACDDCCEHGNEDGHCRPVREWVQDVMDDLTQALDAAQENLKALERKIHVQIVVTISGSAAEVEISSRKP